jgi:phosphatidylserine synthase
MLFPLGYLLSYIIPGNIFKIVYMVITGLIGILFVTKIKIPKPKLLVSIFLLLLAIVVSSLYLFVL